MSNRANQFVVNYVLALQRFRVVIIILFVAGAAVAALFMSEFLNATSSGFHPPSDSPSAIAMDKKSELFPASREGSANNIPILVTLIPPAVSSSSSCPFMASNLTLASPLLESLLDNFTETVRQLLEQKIAATLAAGAVGLRLSSYARLRKAAPIYASSQFLSNNQDDQHTLLIPVTYTLYDLNATETSALVTHKLAVLGGTHFALFVHDEAVPAAVKAVLQNGDVIKSLLLLSSQFSNGNNSSDHNGTTSVTTSPFVTCTDSDWTALPNLFQVSVTGFAILSSEMIRAGKSGMALTDSVVIPIAISVMGLTVRSFRMMVLPLLSIGLALVISFGIMAGVSDSMAISTAAPSLMMSLSISTSTDFTLFIAARFIETVALQGARGPAAVVATLLTAGHTILLSGITFSVSLVPLAFFPTDLLRSFGVSAVVTVAAGSMLISLVLVPALILMFPTFFEEAALPLVDTWAWKHVVRPYLLCGVCCSENSSNGANDHRYQNENVSSTFINSSRSRGRPGSVQAPSWKGPESIAGGRAQTECTDGGSIDTAHDTQHTSASAAAAAGGPDNIFTTESLATVDGAQCYSNNNNYYGSTHHQPSGVNLSGALYFDAPIGSNNRKGAGVGGAVGSAFFDSSGVNDRAGGYQTRGAAAHEALVHGSSVFGKLAPVFASNAACVVVLLVVAVVCGLFAWAATDFAVASNLDDYLPRSSKQMAILAHYQRAFGYGAIDPVWIMFVATHHKNSNILSNASIATAQSLIYHIASQSGTPYPSGFSSVILFDGMNVSSEAVRSCSNISSASPRCSNDLRMQFDASVNADRTALLVRVDPPVDPVGYGGNGFYTALKSAAALNDGESRPFDVYVVSGAFTTLDAVAAIYGKAPTVAIVTCVAVLVVVGVAFKSIVFPLRSLVTILLTQTVVFGSGVLIYQHGVLDWVGWGSIARADPGGSSQAAIGWLPPLVSFCISIGVALDCDLFLLIRTHELILTDGVSTREAIVLGLCSSGRVINSAGLILAVAFAGLALQEIRVLNEMGILLMIATLFDTFIMRGLATPALVALLGRAHWWPSNPEQEAHEASSGLQPDLFDSGAAEGAGTGVVDDDSVPDGVNGPLLKSRSSDAENRATARTVGLAGAAGSPIRGAASARRQLLVMTGAASSATGAGGDKSSRGATPRDQLNLSRARLDALQSAQM